MGTFYLVKISRNFSSAVNGKRSLVRPTGKFSEKVEILRRLVPYDGPQLSRQNQKPRGKNKIPHGNTKNLTAKSKYLTAKSKYLTAKPKTSRQNQNTSRQNTSQQNQILHSKNQLTDGKSKYPQQNQSYFAFAVKYLVLL